MLPIHHSLIKPQRINVYDRPNFHTRLFDTFPNHDFDAHDKALVRIYDMRFDHRKHVLQELDRSIETVFRYTQQQHIASDVDMTPLLRMVPKLHPRLELRSFTPHTEVTMCREFIGSIDEHASFHHALTPVLEKFLFSVNYGIKLLSKANHNAVDQVFTGFYKVLIAHDTFMSEISVLESTYVPRNIPLM
jgi:hypothetical protein